MKVICKTCHEDDKKSTVFEVASQTTLVGYFPFHDETGRRHLHDSNDITTRYRCSEGHGWIDIHKKPCWCGWPEKETK